MNNYSIVNPSTERTLVTCSVFSEIQYFWNHIPRRKNSELYLVDNSTGEILKVKPCK